MGWALVFLGGGLGASLRHGLNQWGLSLSGPGFPWWTMAANIGGSFLMGLAAGGVAQSALHPDTRLMLTTGVLGGFTTFSAFSLDAVGLWQRGETTQALAYVALSVALAIVGLVAGLAVTRLA